MSVGTLRRVTPEEYIRSHLDDIPGWFDVEDAWLFHWTLSWQERTMPRGDLAELGVYLGRSAVLIGLHRRPDETFTVCDLFELDAASRANMAESAAAYSELSRRQFLTNYGHYVDAPRPSSPGQPAR